MWSGMMETLEQGPTRNGVDQVAGAGRRSTWSPAARCDFTKRCGRWSLIRARTWLRFPHQRCRTRRCRSGRSAQAGPDVLGPVVDAVVETQLLTTQRHFSGDPAIPVPGRPRGLRDLPATDPTPPAAPDTTTVSPGFRRRVYWTP